MPPDSFSPFPPSGPVAAVKPDDLRRAWEFQQTLTQNTKATGMDLLKQVCQLGDDTPAVVYRLMMLGLLGKTSGRLAAWQRDGKFDDAVFQVAATFPMDAMQVGQIYNELPFDIEEFLKQLENTRTP
jgi:hypothetical protein